MMFEDLVSAGVTIPGASGNLPRNLVATYGEHGGVTPIQNTYAKRY